MNRVVYSELKQMKELFLGLKIVGMSKKPCTAISNAAWAVVLIVRSFGYLLYANPLR
jgi:hypothetical protein